MASFRSSFVIEALDRFTIPFRSISKEAQLSSDRMKESAKGLRSVKDQLSNIDAFHKHKNAAAAVKKEYRDSAKKLDELSEKLKSTTTPSRELREEFRKAEQETKRLKREHESLTQKTTTAAARLKEFGITKKNISQETHRLRKEEEEYNKTLERQKKRVDEAVKANKTMEEARTRKERRQASAQAMAVVGETSTNMGMGIFNAMRSPVQTAIDFEAQMSAVGAMALGDVTNLDEKAQELKRLKDIAIDLGASTSFSAQEVGAAQEELAKAGVSYKDITKENVSGLLDVAKAGKLGLEEATSISTSVVRGFGLEIGKLGEVGDILSYTANVSSTDIHELGEVFKEVGPIAKTAGVDLKSVSGMIASLANVGIRGSIAGTALKNTILNLASPAAGGAKALKRLHIETRDAHKNLRPLSDILADVAAKTAKMGTAERVGIFEKIAGREGLAGFSALVEKAGTKEGMAELKQIETGFDNVAGSAKRMGDALSDNTKGALQELSSSWEGLVLTVMDAAIPVIRDVVKALAESVGVVTKYAKENPELTASILGTVAALGSFLVVGGTLFKLFSVFKMSLSVVSYGFTAMRVSGGFLFRSLLGGFKLVALGLRALTAAFGATGVGAIVIALGLAATAIWYYWDDIAAFFLKFWEPIKPKWEKFATFLSELFAPFIKLYDKFFGGGDKTITVKHEGMEPKESQPFIPSREYAQSFMTGPSAIPLRDPQPVTDQRSMDFSITAPMTFYTSGSPEETRQLVGSEFQRLQDAQDRKMRARKAD